MQAIICHGPKDYRVEQVTRPKPGPNEILIRIGACGICASDCKCYNGAKMYWGETPWVKAPVVPGHEFFGYVEELGTGAGEHFEVKLGDRVTAEQVLPCRRCHYCKTGKYWMCETNTIFGFCLDGGMSEYMLIPATSNVYKIPESLTLEQAGIVEPLACAIHAVKRCDIQLDDVVVVAGAGTLGLLMVQVAHLKTPRKLIVIDMVDERLALAKKYGADIVINPKTEDIKAIVKQHSNGYGCDVYMEVTGSQAGVTQGLDIIRRQGRFMEFSIFGHDTTTDWSVIDRWELDIRGSHLGPYSYPIAIDLLDRGLVTPDGIVTHTYKIKDWDEAIQVANSLDSVKVLIVP